MCHSLVVVRSVKRLRMRQNQTLLIRICFRMIALVSMVRGIGPLLRRWRPRSKVGCVLNDRSSFAPRWSLLTALAGKRSDLDGVKALLDSGAPMRQIADDCFSAFIRYEKGFRSYKRLKSIKRDWAMDIIIIVGPSGTGKTRFARENYPDAYWKPKGRWWDGYDGEETVVVDEMYGHCFPYTELLQLTDRYPYAVEVKGGVVEFISRRIIFTSNQHPQDWYNAEKTHHGPWESSPLHRRIRDFGRIIMTGEVHRGPVIVEERPIMASGDSLYLDSIGLLRPRCG